MAKETSDVQDLDTFSVVWGEIMSVRKEHAEHVSERTSFAAAIAEGNAAGELQLDAQANHDYSVQMRVEATCMQ